MLAKWTEMNQTNQKKQDLIQIWVPLILYISAYAVQQKIPKFSGLKQETLI